jgi:hypothetical protein
MTEALDDSKYAKGTGIFSIYEKVDLPADPKKRCTALLELGNESLLANDFNILDFLPYPGLGNVGPNEVLQYSWILSESHRLLVYDPKTRRLIDELYTCSPEKDGRLMFERTNKLLKKPAKTVMLNEIVGKDMALKEEPDKLFHSVKKAAGKLRFSPEANYCVSAVFFDIPDRKLESSRPAVTTLRAIPISTSPRSISRGSTATPAP